MFEPEYIPEESIDNLSEKHKEEGRDLILEIARRLFAKRGYAATSTRLIAEEAGVSSGLIFHHFKTKSELLQAILLSENEIVKALTAALQEPDLTVEGLLQLCRNFFIDLLKPESSLAQHLLIRVEARSITPSIDAFAASISEQFPVIIAKFLQNRIEAGELPDGLDTLTAARALQSAAVCTLLSNLHHTEGWEDKVIPLIDAHLAYWQQSLYASSLSS
ncbi:MAG: hypothetical protein CMF31_06510 [Kordiimonas sp.]|nr:hypothetical protein [Kordiimonas sp.]|tara:strand:- start:1107 stop:1763 length:657 start_codon:yes stop_codon:yes gene_type:complete